MTPFSDDQLWSLACEAYGDDLPGILGSIVSAYERRPGLNVFTGQLSALMALQRSERPLLRSALASISSKVAWRSASLWRGISYAICSIS